MIPLARDGYLSHKMLPSLRHQTRQKAEELRSSGVSIGSCHHPYDALWNDTENGQVVCRSCGVVLQNQLMIESLDSISDRDGDRQRTAQDMYTVSKSVYVRQAHLDDFFNNNRGLKTPELHPIVLETLRYELDRHGLTVDRINDLWIRFFLRCHNWVNYYEFTPYFRQVLVYEKTGKTTTITRGSDVLNRYDCLTDELEDVIRRMMRHVERVYWRCVPENRKNFFSMQFFVRKCLELLGEHERAEHFELPKTTRIREAQERAWTLCCKCLQWPEKLSLSCQIPNMPKPIGTPNACGNGRSDNEV